MVVNWYCVFCQYFYGVGQSGVVFEFDYIGVSVYYDGGICKGLFGGGIGYEWQVGKQQVVWCVVVDGVGVIGDIFYGNWQGGVVILYCYFQ